MFDLLKAGLLHDENGKINAQTRYKILDAFGYGGWEQTQDVNALHVARAGKENLLIDSDEVEVSEVDNHALHVDEHTKYFLGSEFNALCEKKPALKEKMLEHIRRHKVFERTLKQAEGE